MTKPNQVFIDLLAEAPTEHFKAGETLMKQGEKAGYALFIRRGTVSIQRQTTNANSSIVNELAVRSEGDLIGELSLFSNERSASVVATSPSECARITHGALLQLISTNSLVALSLLASVMEKAQSVQVTQINS
jgi:CRP-like cAMP-binding protein